MIEPHAFLRTVGIRLTLSSELTSTSDVSEQLSKLDDMLVLLDLVTEKGETETLRASLAGTIASARGSSQTTVRGFGAGAGAPSLRTLIPVCIPLYEEDTAQAVPLFALLAIERWTSSTVVWFGLSRLGELRIEHGSLGIVADHGRRLEQPMPTVRGVERVTFRNVDPGHSVVLDASARTEEGSNLSTTVRLPPLES